MSTFAIAVCNAIEGLPFNKSELTSEESEMLLESVNKKNFVPVLRYIINQDLPTDLMLRLNKAIAKEQVVNMAIPVTGA
ncbi:hypothetical protein Xbed_00616 [Xenorhabdus beddingii]|uniref:Uncharacterized protein n=1 Tax=Xenorhabdus beddingii TaxID=40578 RepID=A0A1Y2STX9_9GAMM|nr:hypothetical protein [Xenorhabdus beddingii]OTA21387.1 hypothetical protein Xbed_00616 [Xenorhabdus beddingii]